jgi:hexosaminidase
MMTLESILRRRAALLLASLALGGSACAPALPPASPVPTPTPAPRPEAAALVPVPLSVTFMPADTFTLDTTAVIVVRTSEPEAARVADFLARLLGNTVASVPKVQPARSCPAHQLALDPVNATLGEEGYELTVDRQRVRILAATPAGLFYGVQTLRQLLPPIVEYTAALPRPLKAAGVRVIDRPRFAWRGAMLDVARHFRTVDEVKRFVDLLALYKLNRLHLHLTDDQGGASRSRPGRASRRSGGARRWAGWAAVSTRAPSTPTS